MPCPLLGRDNYCAVYADRPKACREYPHTDRRNTMEEMYEFNTGTAYRAAGRNGG